MVKHVKLFFVLIAAGLFFASSNAALAEEKKEEGIAPPSVEGATKITTADAEKLLARGVPFVDVRSRALFDAGHIKGARNISLQEGKFTEENLSKVVGKDEEVVIYCRGATCMMSSQASTKAIKWGFTKIYYFRRGYNGWIADGYPISTEFVAAQ